MNIKEAKQEIANTARAYLARDGEGAYRIPAIRQRPILLMGPPGIGKTQIMEQVARELGIGLVSYTITHHTRQSAVGLPFIREEEFDGEPCSVTAYTMSEIIASVRRKMRDERQREGILFIDEINCVSETLAPTMLQFLQCKTFGNQAVPEGWIIVAAGNPPEYNRSVREFDMVTIDRVRYISVEPDYAAWERYAVEQGVHGAILGYLKLHPQNFYRVESDVDGLRFVTARGWEDLSCLMAAYGDMGVPVDAAVAGEYLHHAEVAEDAAAYFELYDKYRDDYGIEEILSGHPSPLAYERVYKASFDERLSVANLLLDGLRRRFREVAEEREVTDGWHRFLGQYRDVLAAAEDPAGCYERLLRQREESASRERASRTERQARGDLRLIALLRENTPRPGAGEGGLSPKGDGLDEARRYFAAASEGFDRQREGLERREEEASEALEHAFDFAERAFEDGQELVIFVTELSLSSDSARFLAERPCERYVKYSESFLIGTRRAELLSEIERGQG